ncbi:hypothetical protein SAMN05216266_109189 [Amycolatopsis marina]|uniref:Transmembrane protein n=1 Tax=Amycolatopsis marina TaxID=490629 RepID=A0A1I1AI69_9PSEU|nr:hypothetical protein [Amycolatopsis marina]SFB37719.1 hypothetical protein SAMN05216266_109189 [Amycolatopsis marina]
MNGNADSADDGRHVDELAADVDAVVSRAARTVDLGRRGFVIAVASFALIVALLLPWVGDYAGWQVLAGDGGAIPRLFAVTSTLIGIVASALTLATQRWWLAWVCAVGGWFASVDGVLAIWSQQSTPATGVAGDGPGAGMILAVVATVILAGNWMSAAWSRT